MRVAGISACVPRRRARTAVAHERFGQVEVDRIVSNTGVVEKREAEPGTTACDLCIAAAQPLVERLGWSRDSIDAVVLVTTLSDHIMPASAHRVHNELGLSSRCLAFDVNLGCSGFTHGMIVVESLLASGRVRRALLLCGEMTSGTIRPRIADAEHRSDLANAVLFGDAGTATALDAVGPTQVRSARFGADGGGFREIIVPGGGARRFWSPALFERQTDAEGEERRPLDLILHGPQVLAFTMKWVPPLLQGLLDDASWSRDDVDSFVLHQANKFMLDVLARRAGMPADKVPLSLDEFGNTSSASIPLTMVTRCGDLLGRPTKWAMLGFGVGLSWSGLALETDGVVTLPLVEI